MAKLVGFDIGEDSVKLAYFSGKTLKKTVQVDMPDAMVSGGRILSMDAMADFLRAAAKENGIPLAGAALALPGKDVFTRTVTVPAMTEQQLIYNLPYEFRDFLTEEKSKYFFDYSVRSIRRDEAGRPVEMELFACAMLKSTVEEYRAMFRRAGFRLQVLTPVECAYGALLAAREKRTGRSGEDCCIVRLGHSTSDLYLYRGAEFDSRREIDIGSARLDELISEQYGVDVHVARGYRQHNYNGVLQSDYTQELYSRLSVEVVKAVNFYNYNNRDRELKNVYFCGDGSLAGVRRAVSENTRLTVCPAEELLPEGAHTDDPWVYLCAIGSVNEGIQGGLE